MAWGLEVNGIEKGHRRERAEEALEAVGLNGWGDRMPDQLSGGMKQRVGLARALAQETPVLLMDEPFSALDPVIRRDLQDELMKLQAELHKTIIFITHDLNEAVRIGDRIAIMRDGVIVQMGGPSEVVLSPANDFVRDFTKEVRLQSMVTAASVMREPQARPAPTSWPRRCWRHWRRRIGCMPWSSTAGSVMSGAWASISCGGSSRMAMHQWVR